MNKSIQSFLVFSFLWANVSIAQSLYVFEISAENIQIQINSDNKIPQLTVYRGYLNRNQIATKNPIIGKTTENGNTLIFKPLVPFSKILKYTIALDEYLHYFELGLEDDYNFVEIANFFPNSKNWPANILKFHILFDKPVSIINVYDHIYLLDENGEKLSRTLLDLGQAITDSEQKTITIWIEPGRQKRDLGPNKVLGSPFEVGKTYRLVVDSSIKDKNGIPMKNPYSKDLIISEPIRKMPDPTNWKIKTPSYNLIQPLYIDTKTAYDYRSILANVFITHDSKEMKGILKYTDNTITFLPNLPWKKGNYTLHVKENIEDLAGNTPQRLFDTDLYNKDDSQSKVEFKVE